ncbi:MAG: hypothetical protein J6Q52_03260 [Clostridia bacterium]|nr:hypothetical protein [Clostridia bacterium]
MNNISTHYTEIAKKLFLEERAIKRLDGWFIIREEALRYEAEHQDEPVAIRQAKGIQSAIRVLPLFISKNSLFAGTERDAFAKSYALINPNFKVSTFNGYCDPTAVFGDIEPNEEFSVERIQKVRAMTEQTPYVSQLKQVYESCEMDTCEVAYFVEQVTGHLIPDVRDILSRGTDALKVDIDTKMANASEEQKINYEAMKIALDSVVLLASRYASIARDMASTLEGEERERFTRMADTLDRVPRLPATSLYEAVQSFMMIWQMMNIEQAPNPFAFSVGNADRIFEPYRQMSNDDRDLTASYFKHLLVFFNVADRSWAISQNLIIGGRDEAGNDLTNLCSYALMDAYYDMNCPQPILSVKLHKNTPDQVYEEMARFFFTPGVLTPSLFNDDSMFATLRRAGVREEHLKDYSIAGCQEPLIMGKDNANTTNTWLNLPKILELTLTDGVSLITGNRLKAPDENLVGKDSKFILENIRALFYRNLVSYVTSMAKAGNGASKALSNLRVPFLSTMMGGIESGYDTRDTMHQGTQYNGSGCLIHGLAILADSFVAIDDLLAERPEDADRLMEALRTNFANDPELRGYLLDREKFGNNSPRVDAEAKEIASVVSDLISNTRNYLSNPFRADWSSPTTHLLYGYWVGATPDGRLSREMLGYGVDPLYGSATGGFGLRVLSQRKLPYLKFSGGYASHIGLDPKYFNADTIEAKGLQLRDKILSPLFFYQEEDAPYYVYFNVTTPDTLRKVLANPKKYAPSGVYIMRIHGTFVNFLDLSPDVQEDIIKRLDLGSTTC